MNILTDADERLYFRFASGNLHDVARLILLQGMRPAEVMGLRKDDVDLDANTVLVRKGKTSCARRLLRLTSESRSILGRRLSSAGPWVFPSEKRPGAHICKLNCAHDRVLAKSQVCECGKTLLAHRAGNGCASFRRVAGLNLVLYDLRHTFATRMIAAGVDVMTLKEIMGHSDIRTTQRYVHPSQARQDEAMAMYERSFSSRVPKGRLV
jgi:integrase